MGNHNHLQKERKVEVMYDKLDTMSNVISTRSKVSANTFTEFFMNNSNLMT